jgi:hypothetical protein
MFNQVRRDDTRVLNMADAEEGQSVEVGGAQEIAGRLREHGLHGLSVHEHLPRPLNPDDENSRAQKTVEAAAVPI